MVVNWGYGAENGPSCWHEGFPVAKEGKRQSPIDIVPEQAIDASTVTSSDPLKWTYLTNHCLNLENTGSTWKVNVNGSGSTLSGGPLDGEFELWQFHAHWGDCNEKGSEHTVKGKMYSGELHLVHWNKKYGSPAEAAGHPDGLAVLGMFIEVGDEHGEFQKITTALKCIKHKGEKICLEENEIDCSKFLPDGKSFWTYEGSLTTPPLLESVIWIVFQEPIQISQEQLETMRGLSFSGCHEKMVNNYRPPCPLGTRRIRSM